MQWYRKLPIRSLHFREFTHQVVTPFPPDCLRACIAFKTLKVQGASCRDTSPWEAAKLCAANNATPEAINKFLSFILKSLKGGVELVRRSDSASSHFTLVIKVVGASTATTGRYQSKHGTVSIVMTKAMMTDIVTLRA